MPQDDVRPCPHCGGTGEVRGETLADKIERARAVTMTPAMQEEQRQSWARSAMQGEEHGTFTPQPPFTVRSLHKSGAGETKLLGCYIHLREARQTVLRWGKESRGRWTYTITDANGNVIPNDTGCSICTDPNCSDPCGKH